MENIYILISGILLYLSITLFPMLYFIIKTYYCYNRYAYYSGEILRALGEYSYRHVPLYEVEEIIAQEYKNKTTLNQIKRKLFMSRVLAAIFFTIIPLFSWVVVSEFAQEYRNAIKNTERNDGDTLFNL